MRGKHFNLNIAKALIGRNVNVHLKDGAVIVNVQILDARKENSLTFIILRLKTRKRPLKLSLKDVEWIEKLNYYQRVNPYEEEVS